MAAGKCGPGMTVEELGGKVVTPDDGGVGFWRGGGGGLGCCDEGFKDGSGGWGLNFEGFMELLHLCDNVISRYALLWPSRPV